MIHYHGAPVTPNAAAATFWPRRHGFVSFAHPEQIALVAELCQSFAVDCGAFSLWKSGGGNVDVDAYAAWVREWETHPGFDFAVVPDVIDGSEADNRNMCAAWLQQSPRLKPGAVVWHLHESVERLRYLVRCVECRVYERLCLGSSGQWSTPGTEDWWQRMEEIRPILTDERGRPHVKIHGLRMLNPTIFSHIPFSSADSCNVALNIKLDTKWSGSYQPITEGQRALVMAERIELHAAASRWTQRHVQQNFELIG